MQQFAHAPHGHDPSLKRFALVRHSLRLRRPLALLGASVAVAGLVANLAGTASPGAMGAMPAATHPVTAILCAVLGLAVASFRYHRPTPWFRYALGILGALLAGERTVVGLCQGVPGLTPALDQALYRPLAAVSSGQVGTDTALLLFFLFCSVLARRHFGRIGLAFALAALVVIINDFVALSYGRELFGGHMAVGTMAALLPLVAAVMILFAHRPFFRNVLLKGDVGRRTRWLAAGAFLIPWGAGLLVHRFYYIPEEAFPVESVMISLIIWAFLLTAQFTGHIQHRADQRRRLAESKLAYLASYDPLTRVLNRRGITAALNVAWQRFRTAQRPAGLIVLDLDHFKAINDRCGHEAGDRVLFRVGEALVPKLRRGDAVGRWGGEEFLIVVDGASGPEGMQALCERLRRTIEGIGPVTCPNGSAEAVGVSASFGLSWFVEGDERLEDAINRADQALYQAKETGRNRTVVFDALRQAS